MRHQARTGNPIASAVALTVSLMLIVPGAKADVAAGREAFNRGDYDRAEAEWRTLAERGIVEGEFGLGEIYEQAKGDYRQAEVWYTRAAEKGSIEARYRLALITLAGNKEAVPEPIKAYKWAILASSHNSVWGQLADDLRALLEKHLTAAEQIEGKKQAEAWREKLNPKPKQQPAVAAVAPVMPAITAPVPPAPGIIPSTKVPGFPNFAGPPLPIRPDEILPPIPNRPAQPPPISGRAVPAAVPPPTPVDNRASEELAETIRRIDCASLTNTTNAHGKPVISGTVPDEGEKAKLIQIAGKLLPEVRPDIQDEIMPPPLCRSLVGVHSVRAASLASDEIEAKLAARSSVLRDGDPIQVEVKAGSYPVNLWIDYFQLDGQVTHMLPNREQPSVKLAAGNRRVFGSGQKGETWFTAPPVGTEFITVLATSTPLDLGERPSTEEASEYLRALEAALRRSRASQPQPNLLATIVLQTKAREQ